MNPSKREVVRALASYGRIILRLSSPVKSGLSSMHTVHYHCNAVFMIQMVVLTSVSKASFS